VASPAYHSTSGDYIGARLGSPAQLTQEQQAAIAPYAVAPNIRNLSAKAAITRRPSDHLARFLPQPDSSRLRQGAVRRYSGGRCAVCSRVLQPSRTAPPALTRPNNLIVLDRPMCACRDQGVLVLGESAPQFRFDYRAETRI